MLSLVICCGLALVFLILLAIVVAGKDPDGKEDIAEYWEALEKNKGEND